jgi:hypothetical protein
MFKRMFQFSSSEKPAPIARTTGAAAHTRGIAELSDALQRETETPSLSLASEVPPVPPVAETFDEVYVNAGIKPSVRQYTILKVAEMVNNKHLADMTMDSKRNALMMALEAAGAEIGDLLQDAVSRNRALDEYEEERQTEVRKFETSKAEENNRLHAELERITSQYMSQIQANSDQVAQEQDNLRSWQKRKQAESQKITDAATFCVPQGNGSAVAAGNLGAVLERVNLARR